MAKACLIGRIGGYPDRPVQRSVLRAFDELPSTSASGSFSGR